MEKDGIRFTLPLMDKRYVLKSAALREYVAANEKAQVGSMEANMVEVNK